MLDLMILWCRCWVRIAVRWHWVCSVHVMIQHMEVCLVLTQLLTWEISTWYQQPMNTSFLETEKLANIQFLLAQWWFIKIKSMARTTTLLPQLRKMRPGLRGLSAISTDGEEALSLAFKMVFPGSSHLLWQIHKRDNIMLKLRSMNANEHFWNHRWRKSYYWPNRLCGCLWIFVFPVNSTWHLKTLNQSGIHFVLLFFDWFIKNKAELMLINHCICP